MLLFHCRTRILTPCFVCISHLFHEVWAYIHIYIYINIILCILRSPWVQWHTDVVSLLPVWIFLCVTLFAPFLCALHVLLPSSFLTCHHCRGRAKLQVTYHTAGFYLCFGRWTCFAFVFVLFFFLLFPFQSCLPCGEGGKEIKMAGDGLTQEINPHVRPTAASLLVPGCAASLWGFVSSRAKKKKKPNTSLHSYCPTSTSRPIQSASQSRCSSPAHLQRGAGSHLQRRLIDLLMQHVTRIAHGGVHSQTISPPLEDVIWRGQSSRDAG